MSIDHSGQQPKPEDVARWAEKEAARPEKIGTWWIEFADGKGGACAALVTETQARELATATGRTLKSIVPLPRAAAPRLDGNDGYGAGKCPSFCYRARHCAALGRCSARLSCVE